MSVPTVPDDWIVYVCDNCKRTSCWMGRFYCDEYKHAGTTWITVGQALLLKREHPDEIHQAAFSPGKVKADT